MNIIWIDPFNDFHMIGHKRWNIAFQNGRISLYYVFIVHLRFVKLADHCVGVGVSVCVRAYEIVDGGGISRNMENFSNNRNQ